MKKPSIIKDCIIDIILIIFCSNMVLFDSKKWLLILAVAAFFFVNIRNGQYQKSMSNSLLRRESKGSILLISFIISLFFTIGIQLLYVFKLSNYWPKTILSIIIAICVESIIFWHGIIDVYTSSYQLGFKERIIGIICGWIPFLNLWSLSRIIKKTVKEEYIERDKFILNKNRADNKICKTKYPILMVHGVFFRDWENFNYWGRIPKELTANGAIVLYGNHQSAASINESAKELANRIKQIVEERQCEKVNIIAHSKGGLDIRLALNQYDISQYIASITTINTPHRGCIFADYLLNKIPDKTVEKIANKYNYTLKKMGDKNPDFIAAVNDLTASKCKELNNCMLDPKDIYFQSVGSKLNKATSGRFPLNISYPLVKHFDGDNDGLVGKDSFQWGDNYQYLTIEGKRGISHGDMIDLNRENIDNFDIREFYVQLVANLKNKGF